MSKRLVDQGPGGAHDDDLLHDHAVGNKGPMDAGSMFGIAVFIAVCICGIIYLGVEYTRATGIITQNQIENVRIWNGNCKKDHRWQKLMEEVMADNLVYGYEYERLNKLVTTIGQEARFEELK